MRFHSAIQLLIGFIFTFGLYSCDSTVYREPINKLPYSAEELKNMKAKMEEVDSIFRLLDKTGVLSDVHQLGYLAYSSDSIYFRYCLPKGSQYYINFRECNFESYIGRNANRQLIASIDSLLTKQVVGLYYSYDGIGALFILGGGTTRNDNDGRFLFMNKNRIDMSRFQYEVMDVKDSVYLLRKKY